VADVSLDVEKERVFSKKKQLNYVCACGKSYTTRQGLYVHRGKCNFQEKTNLQDEVNELKQEITNLREHLLSRVVTNNTTNNITNNIQNNIVLHGFGHETLTHLPKSFLNYCFANKDIVQLIENVHFDKECPENQNVRIKSSKNELMEYYQNGGWVLSTQDRILTELVQKGYRILRTHGKKNKDGIMEDEDLEEDDYNNVLRWLEDVYEDERQQKPIKKDLLVLFLNNRPILLGKDS
jgi:hypothetical protein